MSEHKGGLTQPDCGYLLLRKPWPNAPHLWFHGSTLGPAKMAPFSTATDNHFAARSRHQGRTAAALLSTARKY